MTESELPPSPVLAFLIREFGPVKWLPPRELVERVARERTKTFQRGLALGLGAVASILAAVATVGPGTYSFSTIFTALAVLLFVGCVWLTKSARDAPPFPFAVFEDGVFVPATFENIPGLQKMGPARAIRKSKIKRIEDVRREGGRAILLWTKAGTGGIVSVPVGDAKIPPEEPDRVLDGFKEALLSIGIQEAVSGEADGGEAGAED